jgi:hypothetical protein
VCTVGGLVDWLTRNAARAMSVSGTSRFEFEVAFARGSFRIQSESSTELRRPRQAASCMSKGSDKAAMSRTIKDAHRDAAHCLQVASRSAPTKLKTALLAQAQVLQRAGEQRAQAEKILASTFAERWTMVSLR